MYTCAWTCGAWGEDAYRRPFASPRETNQRQHTALEILTQRCDNFVCHLIRRLPQHVYLRVRRRLASPQNTLLLRQLDTDCKFLAIFRVPLGDVIAVFLRKSYKALCSRNGGRGQRWARRAGGGQSNELRVLGLLRMCTV
jgi:hypothetical protein